MVGGFCENRGRNEEEKQKNATKTQYGFFINIFRNSALRIQHFALLKSSRTRERINNVGKITKNLAIGLTDKEKSGMMIVWKIIRKSTKL